MRFNSGYCWTTPYENVKVTTNSFEMLLYDRINSNSLTGQDYIDFLKSNPLTIWCV